MINFKKEQILHGSKMNEILSFMKEQSLKKTKADEMFEAIASLVTKLEKVSKDVLKNVDISEILSAVKSLANKDEDKIVKGILDFQSNKTENK